MNCIYKIVCEDEFYIGSTSNFHKRKQDHTYRCKDLKYSHMPLYKKMNKTEYKFEVVEMVSKEINLIEVENSYLLKLKPSLNCRNAVVDKERRKLLKNEREKRRYFENKKEMSEKSKIYYQKNKEKVIQKQKEYYEKNKEEINRKLRESRAKKKNLTK